MVAKELRLDDYEELLKEINLIMNILERDFDDFEKRLWKLKASFLQTLLAEEKNNFIRVVI